MNPYSKIGIVSSHWAPYGTVSWYAIPWKLSRSRATYMIIYASACIRLHVVWNIGYTITLNIGAAALYGEADEHDDDDENVERQRCDLYAFAPPKRTRIQIHEFITWHVSWPSSFHHHKNTPTLPGVFVPHSLSLSLLRISFSPSQFTHICYVYIYIQICSVERKRVAHFTTPRERISHFTSIKQRKSAPTRYRCFIHMYVYIYCIWFDILYVCQAVTEHRLTHTPTHTRTQTSARARIWFGYPATHALNSDFRM